MQKSPVKKYFIFLEIQKRQISDKKIHYCSIILLLFALRNLSFLYFPKYNIFFNKTFLHTLFLYISIYIFNLIIFYDIKVWNFKIFKILKMEEAPVPICTKSVCNVP
jgi:hypothetical protein